MGKFDPSFYIFLPLDETLESRKLARVSELRMIKLDGGAALHHVFKSTKLVGVSAASSTKVSFRS